MHGYTKESRGEDRKKVVQKNKKEGQEEEPKYRHTLHTISGSFSGGGESSSSQKKYIRQVMLYEEDNKHSPTQEPDITFTPKECSGMTPHDDDPMVITLQIFKWIVKRVLINPGSSTDIIYHKNFERMGLNYEQMQPFNGTQRVLSQKFATTKGKEESNGQRGTL